MANSPRIRGLEKSNVPASSQNIGQTSPANSAGPAHSISRRQLLQMGSGLAAAAIYAGSHGVAALAAGSSSDSAAPAILPASSRMPRAPNIVVLMTDQERHHMHWPAGWTEKNLPSLQRLKRNGLYFNRAYTAVTQCSPSRASMMTGRFAPINRVTRTFLWPGLVHRNRQPNIASLLKE